MRVLKKGQLVGSSLTLFVATAVVIVILAVFFLFSSFLKIVGSSSSDVEVIRPFAVDDVVMYLEGSYASLFESSDSFVVEISSDERNNLLEVNDDSS